MFPLVSRKTPTGGLTSGDTMRCGLTILQSWLGALCQRLCETSLTFTPTGCFRSSLWRESSVLLRFIQFESSPCPHRSNGSATTLSVGVAAAALSVRHSPAITWQSMCRQIATAWLTMPTRHFALRQSLRLAVASQGRIMLLRFGERNMQANHALEPTAATRVRSAVAAVRGRVVRPMPPDGGCGSA